MGTSGENENDFTNIPSGFEDRSGFDETELLDDTESFLGLRPRDGFLSMFSSFSCMSTSSISSKSFGLGLTGKLSLLLLGLGDETGDEYGEEAGEDVLEERTAVPAAALKLTVVLGLIVVAPPVIPDIPIEEKKSIRNMRVS